MIHKIAYWLLIIGGLAWLVDAFGYGLDNYLPSTLAMIIYILVGLSAIYEIFTHRGRCKECMVKSA